MDIQFFSLLAAIITIITGLLTLSEKFKELKLIKIIGILCSYVLPIVFIQQVINLTYIYKDAIMLLYIMLIFILILYLYHHYKSRSVNNDKTLKHFFEDSSKGIVIAFILILSIFLNYISEWFIRELLIENFTLNRELFISNLNTYKISSEMFNFLKDNILMTACMIIDTSNILIIFFTILNMYKFIFHSIDYKADTLEFAAKPISKKEKKHQRKHFRFIYNLSQKTLHSAIISVLVSSGLPFYLLNQAINLF